MSLWQTVLAVLRVYLLALRVYLLALRLVVQQLMSQPLATPDFPVENGRVAMVTGGTRGIGFHTAKHLAKLGVHVIIAGNNVAEGTGAVLAIQEATGNDQVEYTYCDLTSLPSVRRCVQRFEAKHLPLHVLVLNAGVMLVREGRTKEGFETHFGLNYMGHFLLANLLLGALQRSGAAGGYHARVVTVASATHHLAEPLRLDDLQEPPRRRPYSPHAAYAQSKLALVMFTYRLQRYLMSTGSYVTANVVDPGVVNTELYSNVCWPARGLKKLGGWLLLRTPQQGAAAVIHAAGAAELEGVGGTYLLNGAKVQSSELSYDEELQKELWTVSCKLSGVFDVTAPVV